MKKRVDLSLLKLNRMPDAPEGKNYEELQIALSLEVSGGAHGGIIGGTDIEYARTNDMIIVTVTGGSMLDRSGTAKVVTRAGSMLGLAYEVTNLEKATLVTLQ